MSAEVKKELHLEIAHVLFMDVVGFSKLLINDQSEILEQLNQLVRETPHFREAEAAGKLIRLSTGDGMALVFSNSAEAPVECALEISKALKSYPQIQLRMGVHSGPVNAVSDVNDRSNVTGAGINMAQRVMDCGDAGHILLSKRVAEDLEQYRQWQPCLHDLCECEVKHGVRVSAVNLYTDDLGNPELPEKFKQQRGRKKTPTATGVSAGRSAAMRWAGIAAALLIVVAVALGLFILRPKRSPTAAAGIPDKSIAVLPFENLSRDPDNAYFADGIQDEILTRLSKIADLKVISRTSTQHYKSAPENLPEIAKQLGVAHVVEGSVQKSGDAVRVNVQLIRATDDSHLWADTFDRKVTDVFSAETEIAKTVADQLGAKLTGREQQAISTEPTDVPEAYDAYLRGLAYSLRANAPTNILPAQNYLRRAVQLDPKFALAWALLCRIDAGGYMSGTLEKTPTLREEARQAAETALALQPNLGEALYARGFYHYGCLRDYDTAIRYFEQARQTSPNTARIPEALAFIARRRGEWTRCDAYFKEAEQLDPRNTSLLEQHALMHIILRRFAEAQREIDEALAIAPDIPDLNIEKAVIAQAEGDLTRAATILAPIQILPAFALGVQTQCRQSIFEKNPAAAVARLQQVLAHADPAIPRQNSELRFSLGWAQKMAGDEAGAHQTWVQARRQFEALLKEQPENSWIMADLALTWMGLGDKAAALRFAEQGIAANPVEKDALLGPGQVDVLARVAAQTGETERAIALIEKLLATPYGGWINVSPLTPAILRLDPMFDPLRSDPRFEKLVASTVPKSAEK